MRIYKKAPTHDTETVIFKISKSYNYINMLFRQMFLSNEIYNLGACEIKNPKFSEKKNRIQTHKLRTAKHQCFLLNDFFYLLNCCSLLSSERKINNQR